ncbi:MAG: hypothetical protein ACREOU_14415 [Candidatus Eiseniibacteriota bacterium]
MAEPRKPGSPQEPDDRSLIDTVRLAQCVGMSRGPIASHPIRSMIVLSLIAWLPPLVLSFAEGRALSGIGIPFLVDFPTAVRSLLVIPLLLFAQTLLRRVLPRIVEHLETSGLIRESDRARYESAKEQAVEARDSRAAKLIVLGIVFGLAYLNLVRPVHINPNSWIADPSGPAFGRSAAGLWQALVAAPIYSYLVVEWLRRIAIWDRFLFHVSRFDLKLVGSHPDRAGGLGFLSFGQAAFGTVLFALSAGFAASVAGRILFEHDELETHLPVIITVVLIEILAILLPLFFFGPVLRRGRRKAWMDYAHLAGRQSQAFAGHWLGKRPPDDEELRASPDVSTTTDMAGVFDVVAEMGPNALLKRTGIAVAGPAIIPFLPLALTVVPLSEILKALAGLVL